MNGYKTYICACIAAIFAGYLAYKGQYEMAFQVMIGAGLAGSLRHAIGKAKP